MSGSSIPYPLRQNKFVDRRIFIDALSRIERYVPLDDYVYISMGGASLEDHALAHSQLGINKLLSIDVDDWTVNRQKFNVPYSLVKPIKASSGELIADFPGTLARAGFGRSPSTAVWLDYTSPGQVKKQLGEIRSLLAIMQPLDILRVTLNAEPDGLYQPKRGEGPPEPRSSFMPKRLEKLSKRLQEFMPTDVTADQMDSNKLPFVLSDALKLICLSAYPSKSSFMALPLSLIRYADGQQMLSVTMIVIAKDLAQTFLDRIRAADWPYFSSDWDVIHQIAIPYLTLRERMFLCSNISNKSVHQIMNEMGFAFDDDVATTESYIEQFSKYYRFYPQFQHINI